MKNNENIFKELRKRKGLTQIDLAQILHVNQTTISKWEKGKTIPDILTLNELSNFFNVSIDYLLGNNPSLPKGIKIPVLGIIPAGVPIEAIENVLDYEEISPDMVRGGKEFFALKIKGDSMSPKYLEGDVVIFQKLDCAETNDDCAVYVNGYDATFKRIRKTEQGLTLQPINSNYDPLFFNPEQVENLPVRIIGKAVEIRRKI